jgi:hypothetical protein
MVFIRPMIINNQKEADTQSQQQYDYIRYQQMRKSNGLGLTNGGAYPVLPYRTSKMATPEQALAPPF